MIDQKPTNMSGGFQSTLLNAVDQAVIATDLEGNITYWNRFAEALYGWQEYEVLGRNVLEVTPAPELVRRASEIMSRLREGNSWSGDFFVRRRDGSPFWAHVTNSPIYDEHGDLVGIVGVSMDVTDRKRLQTEQHSSLEQFRILSDTASDLLLSDDPRTLLDRLFERLSVAFGLEVYFHFQVNDNQSGLTLAAYGGVPEATAAEIEVLEFGQAVCGTVAKECTPIIAEDIQNRTDEMTNLIRSLGITAYLCHPLIADDRLIGTLSFGTRKQTQFDENTIAMVRTVSNQVAAAVGRKQAVEALKHANEALDQRVSERTADLERLNSRLRRLAQKLTETEQRERQRLVQVIHDHLQQLLVAARMRVSGVHLGMNDSEDGDALALALSLLDEAIGESRSLTAQLRPPVLYESGLTSALQWLASWMEETHGLKVETELDPAAEPDLEHGAVLLFESARELLLNAVKYAGVDRINVSLRKMGVDRLCLTVEDSGKGFDVNMLDDSTSEQGGFGLFSIRERLRLLNGEMEVDSSPGNGTTIRLIASLTQRESEPIPIL